MAPKIMFIVFFSLLPSVTVSEVMKHAKAKSSKWVNEKNLIDHRFEWQKGFGAFTYSKSHVSNVFKYIENQETHHQKLSFREEYIQMLNKFGIPYEEKFIFHTPLE
ncbi:transposase [Echinicola sediminis]